MSKTRVCRLAIRANQSIDVFDLREILNLVPDDTKVIGFERSYAENSSFVLLENETFKEISMGEIVPRVNVFEDEDGRFTADFSGVLKEQEPEKLRGLTTDNFWIDGDYHKAMVEHIEEHRKYLEKQMQDQIVFGTSRIIPEIKIDDPIEDSGWAIKNADGTRWVDDFEHFTQTPEEEECQHEWKSYMGLSEQFSYCIHCDEKRK